MTCLKGFRSLRIASSICLKGMRIYWSVRACGAQPYQDFLRLAIDCPHLADLILALLHFISSAAQTRSTQMLLGLPGRRKRSSVSHKLSDTEKRLLSS